MFLQGVGRLTDLMYVQEDLKGSEYGHQHLFFFFASASVSFLTLCGHFVSFCDSIVSPSGIFVSTCGSFCFSLW